MKTRNIIIVIIAVGLLIGASKWYKDRNETSPSTFRTAPVARGDIVATISATGTVEPEEVIDVGAQVAGRINEFGKDRDGKPVDYGSHIEKGTILALIDTSLYQSDVASADAQLKQAQAGVTRAEADLAQFKAKFAQAERDWARAQKLGPSDALAQVDYDTYQSNFESARANVAVGEASVEQAKRVVSGAEAALARAKQNLGYCTIASPVKGVIIDRRVNIGQTVVSSLNAPSLFLIAKDLNRMQVWVAVNEADIGSIHAGQPVTFSVDAFPGEVFRGQVSKVRLNATMTQNVVTYTVEVTTDNSSGKLLPYLTANAQFEVHRREDVLTVPNTALRWTPTPEQMAPDARETTTQKSTSSEGVGRRRSSTRPTTAASNTDGIERKPGTVWVLDGTFVRPMHVMAGATDGSATEIFGKDIAEGTEVVVGEQTAASKASAAPAGGTNPFAPQMPRGGGGRRGGGRGG